VRSLCIRLKSSTELVPVHHAEAHSNAVVNSPISLAPDLAVILEGNPDFKVKHGVIGLLKNLAQSTNNRTPLGQAGIVARLADCGIFEDKSDMMEIIQVSAIGVVKHLCNGNGSCLGFRDHENY
jgi:hypothetical protein